MKIGLTGGIGCGKSTVVELFAAAGWRTLELDAIVRDLIAEDESVHAALRQRWGDGVLDAQGGGDRKAIAAKVFSDVGELDWLERLLHPRVRAAWAEAVEADSEANWLVEIPLLFEKRLESEFNLTVCVISPPDIVAARMVRRGYTEAELAQRRRRQMPLEEKARRADRVLFNAGSIEFLKRQTQRLIEETERQ